MRHVDDGTLHAWLDGEVTDAAVAAWVDEHLRDCADCATRLAAARATLEQADALLALTPPALERPPFAALVARAEGKPLDEARGSRRWVMPASWAASLLLAGALGWAVRDLAPQDRLRQDDATLVAEAPAASVDVRPRNVPVPPAGAPAAPQAAPTRTPAAQSASAPASGPQASAPPDATALRREAAAAADAVAGRSGERSASIADLRKPGGDATAADDAQARTPDAPRSDVANDPSTPPAPEPAAVAAQPSAPPVVDVQGTSRSAAPPRVVDAPLAQRVIGASAGRPAGDAAGSGETAWRAVARTEAAVATRMPLYGIEGLVPALTALDAGGTAVRTVYRLPSGSTVELLQQQVADDAADGVVRAPRAQPFPAGGRAETRAAPEGAVWSGVRGDVRLTLRAETDGPDLPALSTRLRLD